MVTSCRWNPVSRWGDEATVKEEKILRFDRVVDEFVSLNSYSALQTMNTEYPRATRLLIEEVLCIGSVEDVRIDQRLREFYQDSTMQILLEDVHKNYATMVPEEKELYSVFHQIKEEDPAFRIPAVYTQVSGLNQSIVVGDSVLGISLDKYLGRDYSLYNIYYHDWQRRMMDRRRIVPDALFYYLSHEYPLSSDRTHTLLDYMLDYAKLQWIIARCRDISLV